jgi:hypothetical protein
VQHVFRSGGRWNEIYRFRGLGYAVFEAVENDCKAQNQSTDQKGHAKVEVYPGKRNEILADVSFRSVGVPQPDAPQPHGRSFYQ